MIFWTDSSKLTTSNSAVAFRTNFRFAVGPAFDGDAAGSAGDSALTSAAAAFSSLNSVFFVFAGARNASV